MKLPCLDYQKKLKSALEYLINDPLYKKAPSILKAFLFDSAAKLYDISAIDLQNYAAAGERFLESPSYPSGCSVGGGISRLFFNLKNYKKFKNEIIEHNLRLIWSVFDITAEGSAAGYDSHGMTLAVLYLETGKVELVREKTSGDIDERGYITISNIFKKCPEIEKGEALVLVTGAQTRAATQGDNMYSRANAHLHSDKMTREIFMEIMTGEELEKFRSAYPLIAGCEGPFSVGHNGDVNSKIKWEKFFLDIGFESPADSDSKEIPRIIRIVYECIMADQILKTETRFIEWLLKMLYKQKVLNDNAKFEVNGQQRFLNFDEQKEVIIATISQMRKNEASNVTIACAAAAKLIYLVDPTSIFVFETLTNIITEKGTVIPMTIIVRGPKSGGMVIYQDEEDPTIPIKFASSLANMRNQIKKYNNEKQEEIPVDYITTGAKILVREGFVDYYSLSDWQCAEICQNPGTNDPVLKIYDLQKSAILNKNKETSPIIDYQLKGLEKTAILKEEGYFTGKSRVERTVIYETILGRVIAGPNFIRGKQIKEFSTEEAVSFAIDNQYGVEIYLSYVTLLRNTRNLFKGEFGPDGKISGRISVNPAAFFNTSNPKLSGDSINKIISKINKIYGFAEGTSRNILGLCFSLANLEGLNGLFMTAMESNLARIEKPLLDDDTLALFVSNSGATKPVVAMAEEMINKASDNFTHGPYIMSVTNLITSELAQLTSKSLGASITNMPWEKAVGSTFAAFTAMQNILTFLVYIHEVKGLIKPERAQYLYKALANFAEVAKMTLSSSSIKEKTLPLARHIAGNAVDISYVGAFDGYDGAEGALKFAEMMQHPRVKFFSGAYEQHGQRATYLRAQRTTPGSLVILHIPNLETSIGSWMAQLIKEDKPRVGKIAVITCEEDAMRLSENGADFVIPAPYDTTSNLFTDALSKLLLDNILTLSAILESNKIAREITSWGGRLLEITSGPRTANEIPGIIKELKIIWKKYKKLETGSMSAEERAKNLQELEAQRVEAIISDEECDNAIAKIYKESRSLSIICAETRAFIDDIFNVLLTWDMNNEEPDVFYNLVNDLILEFSDRSLAMKLADNRFEDSPYLSKMAIHYQGIAKIIGANPIKPDNIAKFQQGWGISSFILEPGYRFSDPKINLTQVFETFINDPENSINMLTENLGKLKYSKNVINKLKATLKLLDVKKMQQYMINFLGNNNYKFIKAENGKKIEYTAISKDFIDNAIKNGISTFNINNINNKYVLEFLILDKFGDAESLTTFDCELRKNDFKELSVIYNEDAFINERINFLTEWFSEEPREDIMELICKLQPMNLVTLEKKELIKEMDMLKDKRNLIENIKFKDIIENMGIDTYGFTINDLKTMKNIFNAVIDFKGGSPYNVQKKIENGKVEFFGMRDKAMAFGLAKDKSSSFDKPGKLKGNKKITCTGGRLKMGYGKDGAPVVIIPWYNAYSELEKIILFHPVIDENLTIGKKIETLGEKYNFIVNHVSEHYDWDDNYLNLVSMCDLMMLSDEEIADDKIVKSLKKQVSKEHSGGVK